MSTPYDAIIGLRERETDAAAQIMREAAERVAALEAQIGQAQANVAREAAFKAEDLAVRSDLYLVRMYGEIAQLQLMLERAQAELDERREVLLQLLAETKALEQVAENYRAAALLAEERAAQAQIDDRIGFLHGARARNAARSVPA
jgi:flagellar biosynthesis chaperone FliJ